MSSTGPERTNEVRLGIIGTVVLVLALVVGFTYESIPFLRGTDIYQAEFSDASGLSEGAEVQVAGVVVGEVRSIQLDDGTVSVGFDADPGAVRLTADTRAAIKVETVLGHRFVELTAGTSPDDLERGGTIPVENTSSGYDITRSLEEVTLNDNSANIDASLTGLQRYATQINDVVGSGPFFGVLLHNILPANLAGQLPGSLGGPR
jgi:phospholipid/cholesterol/gamma-HCH transport system substrate-binding protein